MLVPATTLARPLSTTLKPPTNPSTDDDSRCASARFWPASSRSSAVSSTSCRPQTPPWLFTYSKYARVALTAVRPKPGIGPEMVETFPRWISVSLTPTSSVGCGEHASAPSSTPGAAPASTPDEAIGSGPPAPDVGALVGVLAPTEAGVAAGLAASGPPAPSAPPAAPAARWSSVSRAPHAVAANSAIDRRTHTRRTDLMVSPCGRSSCERPSGARLGRWRCRGR